MRFAFVHAEKVNHAVRCLCRVLRVTPSGYYAWAKRRPSRRQRENARLTVRIRAIHAASRGTYGSPRVYEQLKQEGFAVGQERVARLLRELGLMGVPQKRFWHTTDSAHRLAVAPNVLGRDFDAERPNERWVTDITYLWTGEGLAVSGGGPRPVRAARGRVGRTAAPAHRAGTRGVAPGAGEAGARSRPGPSLGQGLPG